MQINPNPEPRLVDGCAFPRANPQEPQLRTATEVNLHKPNSELDFNVPERYLTCVGGRYMGECNSKCMGLYATMPAAVKCTSLLPSICHYPPN